MKRLGMTGHTTEEHDDSRRRPPRTRGQATPTANASSTPPTPPRPNGSSEANPPRPRCPQQRGSTSRPQRRLLKGAERAPAGVAKTFRAYDPEQVLLMAPVLSEWAPEGDLAHFVSDLVESGVLDLSALYASS
jgi:hypothetical protein